jgi:hypothetical protein
MFFCFRLIVVEFARSPMRFLDRKPLNMGIAGVEPRQLALTMGMTGSGSMDSLAPSPTNAKIDIDPAIDTAVGIAEPIYTDTNTKISTDLTIDAAISIAVLTDADTNTDTNAEIDIESTIDTAAGIAVPDNADTNAKIDIDPAINMAVGIAVPIYTDAGTDISIDATSSSATELVLAATIVGLTSGAMGAVLAITGGFDMAFGLFSFHMDSNGVAKLISVSDSVPPTMTPGAPPVTGDNPSATASLAPSAPLEEEPRLEELTPSVGSNGFEDPPPSPTTAYCEDCDAYHYVGAEDFSSHEIAGCEDPREGTAAVYPTIFECERALNALTLRTAP